MKATILKTKTVFVNGERKVVTQCLGISHRQDIFYAVDGKKSRKARELWFS